MPSGESHIELVFTKTGFLRGNQQLFAFNHFGGAMRYDPINLRLRKCALRSRPASY